MKKLLLCMLLFSAASALFAEALRIDIAGLPENVIPKEMTGNSTCEALLRNGKINRKMIFPVGNDWQEFTFAIESPTACNISFALRSTDKRWVAVDDIVADKIVVSNGNLEEFIKANRLKFWSGSKITLEKTMVKSGKTAIRVNYDNRISSGNIAIPANTKVVFKGFCRKLDSAAVSSTVATGKKNSEAGNVPAGANITFNPGYAPDAANPMLVSVGRLEFRPTFENCGVYINMLPEERTKKQLKAEFYFRKKGAEEFRRALDPAEIPVEKAWRGSLLLLEENTAYEFKAVITAEGNYKNEVTGEFRTMNSNVPFETIVLPAGPMTAKLVSGTRDKYIRYTSNGKKVTAAGKDVQAVFAVEKLQYIIFDNIEIDAANSQHGFLINNSSDIIIRNCDIYNFGRKAAKQVFSSGLYYSGGWHTDKGLLLYDDCAFRMNDSKNILIERNYAHDPAFPAQTWLFAHPSGAGCLKAVNCSNSVIRYNDFIGRDSARFIDLIISPPNTSFRGGIYRDADYYGNMFALSNDDGAELEGGEMNARCYGNRIELTLSGISTGPIVLGPSYLFGNLYANPGDEEGSYSQAYKNGGGAPGKVASRGQLFMMHNSVGDSWNATYGMGNFSIPHKDYIPKLKGYLRNNILRGNSKIFHRTWCELPNDSDGDLMVRVGKDSEAAKMDDENFRDNKLEPNGFGIFSAIEYVSAATGNYGIKPGAPGYRKALTVANLEHYPQTGAYMGYEGEWFPKRPLDLFIDTTELHWLRGDSRVQTVTVTAGKTMKENFKIRCNDEFFTVKPAEGKFEPGKKITFTVTLNENVMQLPRRYSGAFLVRVESGLSLPVTVFADRSTDVEKILANRDKFLKAKKLPATKGKFAFEFDVPAGGTYFMIVRGTTPPAIKTGRTLIKFNGLDGKVRTTPVGTNNLRLIKDDKFHRLEAFVLSKGTHKVEFGNVNGVDISEAYLTQVPWEIMRNRNKVYKKGK